MQEGDYATPLTFADAAALCKVVERDECPDHIVQLFRNKARQGLVHV